MQSGGRPGVATTPSARLHVQQRAEKGKEHDGYRERDSTTWARNDRKQPECRQVRGGRERRVHGLFGQRLDGLFGQRLDGVLAALPNPGEQPSSSVKMRGSRSRAAGTLFEFRFGRRNSSNDTGAVGRKGRSVCKRSKQRASSGSSRASKYKSIRRFWTGA